MMLVADLDQSQSFEFRKRTRESFGSEVENRSHLGIFKRFKQFFVFQKKFGDLRLGGQNDLFLDHVDQDFMLGDQRFDDFKGDVGIFEKIFS
jgi:hypothetical protein